jgi:hypothetical protein
MSARNTRLALLVVILGATLARAQKVKVGYDKSADFAQFKTYAWMPRQTPATMPLLATSIQLDVDHALAAKGLTKVESNPDLLVTYQSGVDAQSAAPALDSGYTASGGIPPPNSTMWGGSLAAGSVAQVVHGTLAVVLIDARQKQTVWSGTAKAKIDTEKQSKLFDQVDKAITEMFKNYPPAKEK